MQEQRSSTLNWKDSFQVDEDFQAIKKRLEIKIREQSHELKEYSRERAEQTVREMRSEIGRLDFRVSGLERLLWNRLFVFLAGAIFGLTVAVIGMTLVTL